MDKDNEQFTPAQVDEQIDLLFHHAPATPDAALIDELHQMYQNDEHSLEKVWQRLGLQGSLSAYTELRSTAFPAPPAKRPQPTSARVTNLERDRQMSQLEKTPIMRKLSLAAAFLVAAVIVGSMFFVFTLTHHSTPSTSTAGHPPVSQVPASPPSGIYLSNKTSVYRVDTQTQKVLWQQSVKNVGIIIPSGDAVYVIQNAGYVSGAALALDANTGKVLWTHSFPAGYPTGMVLSHNLLYASTEIVTPGTPVNNPPVGGKKEVGDSAVGKVYLLNPQDGSQQAVYSNLDSAWSLVAADGILGVSAGTGLQILDAATMKPLWKATIASPTNEPVYQMKIVNGVLYALYSTNNDTTGEGISYIAAYKDATGQQIWKSPDFPGDAVLRFTVDQHIVYFGTSTYSANGPFKGTMNAFDTQSNKQLWSQSVDGAAQNTPVVSNGVVYIEADRGSNDKAHIAAFDATTGTVKWQKALQNNFGGGFNVINGTVYAANPSVGRVNASTSDLTVALKAADGTQLWSATQFSSAETIVPTV